MYSSNQIYVKDVLNIQTNVPNLYGERLMRYLIFCHRSLEYQNQMANTYCLCMDVLTSIHQNLCLTNMPRRIKKILKALYFPITTLNTFDCYHNTMTQLRWNDPMNCITSRYSARANGMPSPDIYDVCTEDINTWMNYYEGELIIRAHQMCNGLAVYPQRDKPNVLTVFTASDYCGMSNCGAFIHIVKDTLIPIKHSKMEPYVFVKSLMVDIDKFRRLSAPIDINLIVITSKEIVGKK